jgi:serine/threonine protein kinase
LWIIFEYCAGGDLLQVIELDKKLPEDTIKKFGRDLAQGLYYLHANGIVFCDLKPSNIFLSGKDMNVKLADFGTSQQLTKNYHFVHECMGTLFYISPEVCKGEPFNTKTDIWALGCILYEMCTNRKPFDGLSDDNLKTKIISY